MMPPKLDRISSWIIRSFGNQYEKLEFIDFLKRGIYAIHFFLSMLFMRGFGMPGPIWIDRRGETGWFGVYRMTRRVFRCDFRFSWKEIFALMLPKWIADARFHWNASWAL